MREASLCKQASEVGVKRRTSKKPFKLSAFVVAIAVYRNRGSSMWTKRSDKVTLSTWIKTKNSLHSAVLKYVKKTVYFNNKSALQLIRNNVNIYHVYAKMARNFIRVMHWILLLELYLHRFNDWYQRGFMAWQWIRKLTAHKGIALWGASGLEGLMILKFMRLGLSVCDCMTKQISPKSIIIFCFSSYFILL